MSGIGSFTSEGFVTIGTVAFLLTAFHVSIGFPFFFKAIIKNDRPVRTLLVTFFISGILMYTTWLIYLWHVNSLFIQIGLLLMILSYSIFLFQAFIQVERTSKNNLH